MKNIYGFVDLYNSPELDSLTSKRSFGSVTFLGRYGLIDFSLSNLTNSGVNRIGIIANRFPNSIRNHIQSGSTFVNNTKTGYINVLFNESITKDDVSTDISTLRVTRGHFGYKMQDNQIVIITPSHLLMSMDFTPIINDHIKSGKDITVVYEHRFDLDKELKGMNLLTINAKNKATFIKRNDGANKEGMVSLDTFILNGKVFEEILNLQPSVSDKYGIREMIKYLNTKLKREVNAYEFNGFVLPITSLQSYINGSFFLLSYLNRLKLFKEDWPIYTATHNTPPAKYGPKANVKNSFIANGSIINGTVENSILSRNVIVNQGAVVKNSIVFTSSEIGKGASINYVLTDKSTVIGEKVSVSGNKKEYYVIKQGEKI